VIWIDLENRRPTDTDLPGWHAWTQERWEAWNRKSMALVEAMKRLNDEGDVEGRNALIDANSSHWGELKPWLLALSGGKCWFTEAREIASHLDVEHFRPKKSARNVKGPVRDGYWWLAFDYMNFRIAGTVPNRKKGVWFPLRYGSRCSSFSRRCEDEEAPYFLDPTNAYDVGLLAFDEEGKAIPMPGVTRWEYVRVRRTVDRLKLSEHQALAEERRKVWQKTTLLIERFYKAKAESGSAGATVARERLRESARQIAELTHPRSELSAVAKCCVLMRHDVQLNKLVA
jgi:hypothetical protein